MKARDMGFDAADWFLYIIGWIFGALNLLFWIISLFVVLYNDYKDRKEGLKVDKGFMNRHFHHFVKVWGMIGVLLFLAGMFILATY